MTGSPPRAPVPRSSWASNPPTRTCSPTSTRGTTSKPDMVLSAAALPSLHGRHDGRTRTHALRQSRTLESVVERAHRGMRECVPSETALTITVADVPFGDFTAMTLVADGIPVSMSSTPATWKFCRAGRTSCRAGMLCRSAELQINKREPPTTISTAPRQGQLIVRCAPAGCSGVARRSPACRVASPGRGHARLTFRP
jgi:hypothetical protein